MNSNYKILLADDSESYLRIIQQIFEIIGEKYELIFAHDGKEACNLALLHKPDLLIFDIIMPEMNGIEASKFIRENEETKDIPIILLSATESLKAAYEIGANDFISKPFNQYELLIKVRSALNLVGKIKTIGEQKAVIEKKHQELIRQNEIITEQQNDILGDIRYSKRIQNSVLPTQELLQEIIPDHFILNLPRNIVSGDFYWVGRHHDHRAIAVADCTGHGISGALMTMAGMAFLNDIMGKPTHLMAHEVLFELRKMIMHLLKQKGNDGEASDGMDISLTLVRPDNKKMYFAGANNPVYIVRNGQLEVIKGDRMPIGIHLNFERPFTLVEIDIEPGDMVYLFSDGFADQFGGPHNKKFRYQAFQNLLFEIHQKPLEIQKSILEKTIIEWKGHHLQVDDMMVLGYKI
ncbi:MAG: response regulator [Bacteroidota bacterium]|nr:MAG: response regulator [Bacteroidota bacterium]